MVLLVTNWRRSSKEQLWVWIKVATPGQPEVNYYYIEVKSALIKVGLVHLERVQNIEI